MALRLTVDLRGASKFRAALQRAIREEGSDRLVLMNRIGLTALRWVDRNFASSGGLVGGWVPLRPGTIFGRRQGSAVPLSNTGMLRSGFTYQATDAEAVVGTANQIAKYHQFGTRPYDIRPRFKKALAFFAPIGGGATATRRRARGAPNVGRVSMKAARGAGLRIAPGTGGLQSMAVVKKVHHPGLPARRMLPRQTEIMPDIRTTITDWLNERLARLGLRAASTTRPHD